MENIMIAFIAMFGTVMLAKMFNSKRARKIIMLAGMALVLLIINGIIL